jgi:cation transport regulator ChaB
MGFLQSWFNLQKEVSSPEQLSQIKGALSEELQEIYEALAEALLDSYSETDHRRELMSRTGKQPRFAASCCFIPHTMPGVGSFTRYITCAFCRLPLG